MKQEPVSCDLEVLVAQRFELCQGIKALERLRDGTVGSDERVGIGLSIQVLAQRADALHALINRP